MPVFSSLFAAIYYVADSVLSLYFWVIIAAVVMSWVNPDPYNPVVRFLVQVTEPVLSRIRKVIPPMGGLDLSPIFRTTGPRAPVTFRR